MKQLHEVSLAELFAAVADDTESAIREILCELDDFREGLASDDPFSDKLLPPEDSGELEEKRTQFSEALLEPPNVQLAIEHLRELSDLCQERGL